MVLIAHDTINAAAYASSDISASGIAVKSAIACRLQVQSTCNIAGTSAKVADYTPSQGHGLFAQLPVSVVDVLVAELLHFGPTKVGRPVDHRKQ